MEQNNNIYSLWDLPIISPEDFAHLKKIEQLHYLAQFGILAPTTHNTVPERFKFDEKNFTIQLLLASQFILPASDKIGRQACVSLGCVTKNIEIAAAYYNLSVDITFREVDPQMLKPHPQKIKEYIHLLTLSFQMNNTSNQPTELFNAITNRKVLRSEYDNKLKLSSHLINRFEDIMKRYISIKSHIIDDRLRLNILAKMQEMADRTVFELETFSYELGNWLLPNTDETIPYAMRGREFGFDDQFSKRIHNGLLRIDRLLPDEIASFAAGGRVGFSSSSAVCVLTINEDSIENWIHAGRAYEHLALYLLSEGWYTAIHAGITEVKVVSRMFSAFLNSKRTATVIFRIGKPRNQADIKRPHSARPKLTELLLT